LFGGVLERFPEVRIILSHGGGALPHIIGRLRQGAAVRPECRTRAQDPIAGLGKLYYDTIVFDPQILRHIVSIVGASQVVLGTDYPFDMSEDDPIGFVRDSGLPAAEIDQILDAGRRLLARDA
jgi:aminocarboxymuconate-semialdehyde decarboxylase